MSILKEKSWNFSVKIILFTDLLRTQKEFELAKQIMRSGTSIGANIEEAFGGQSRKDFIAKLYISYKELRETDYWLRLLIATNKIRATEFKTLAKDLIEIRRILVSTLKTTQKT